MGDVFAPVVVRMPLTGSVEIPLDIVDIEPFVVPQMLVKQVEGHLTGLVTGTFEIEARALPSNDLLATLTWTANGRQKISQIDYDFITEEQSGLLLTVTSAGIGVTSCTISISSRIMH
jgi:hypothetical protein